MGIKYSSGKNHSRYIEKINRRRTYISNRFSLGDCSGFKHLEMKKNLSQSLENSFPFEVKNKEEYKGIKSVIEKATSKEVISTFAYIQWEKVFIDMIKGDEHPLILMEIESSRFSNNMLSKVKKNIFWKIVKVFDYVVAKKYQGVMIDIFDATCQRAAYKVSDRNFFYFIS